MEPDPPPPGSPEPPGPPPNESVSCARCGRQTPLAYGRCLFCQARLPGAPPVPRVVRHSVIPEEVHRGIAWLFWMFGLMLLSNVILSWTLKQFGDHITEE